MLSQSFWIVLIQLVNLIIGTFVTFYIASNVEPQVYSIFAIYQIVTTFMAAFCFMGYETKMMRGMLLWKKNNNQVKIKFNVTMAIFSRAILWFIFSVPLFIYINYLNSSQYNGDEGILLGSFVVAGLAVSIIQSVSLILKSEGKYLEAILISVLFLLVVKVLSLFLFEMYGFFYYICSMVVGVFFISLFSVFRLRYLIDIRFFRVKAFFKFGSRKYFVLTSYCQYLTNYVDRVIVSFVAPPEVLGSYNFAKQIQEIGKSFIEGFFDPISQKLIYFKDENVKLKNYLSKIVLIQYIVFGFSFLFLLLTLNKIDYVISALRMTDYPFLSEYIFYAMLSSFIYIFYKVQLNFSAYFLKPKVLFYFYILLLFFSMVFVFYFCSLENFHYLYINRFFMEASVAFFSYLAFRYLKNEKGFNSIL